MILVSACLLGLDCRYDGGNNQKEDLIEFLKDKPYMVVCPEQMGGLQTPREPAEIIEIDGELLVRTATGKDVTKPFKKGADETLKLQHITKASFAILKAKSPSCGSFKIYDGTFTGTLIEGQGFTSKLLRENGVQVFNENNFREMNWRNTHEE